MKYPLWNDYSDARHWHLAKKETQLETRNATTKEDLVNMLKFLVMIADYRMVETLEEEWEEENESIDSKG